MCTPRVKNRACMHVHCKIRQPETECSDRSDHAWAITLLSPAMFLVAYVVATDLH